ncbi:hypothetical protein [Nocardia wallacei]|uniref:hypothetical protein n=1 Tax=Nocardia wallacei TaxID=480035 RepID=UPI0024542AAE|nr:hypothetical protein [Nocardia wallacei]
MDWGILRLRHSVLNSPAGRPVDRLFSSPRATTAYLVAGPLSAAVSVLAWRTPIAAVSGFTTVVFALLLAVRFPFGRDGADQLALLLTLATAAYSLAPTETAARVILLVICAHMTGSYLVAGWSKLVSRAWTTGNAMHLILTSSCYGNPHLARAIPKPLQHLAGVSAAVFEALFFVVWFADPPIAFTLLGIGLFFHLMCWVAMGLNTFLLTYAAGYPALVWMITRG